MVAPFLQAYHHNIGLIFVPTSDEPLGAGNVFCATAKRQQQGVFCATAKWQQQGVGNEGVITDRDTFSSIANSQRVTPPERSRYN